MQSFPSKCYTFNQMRIKIASWLVASAVIWLFLGHEVLVLLLSIYLTYIIFNNCLSNKLFNSILLRITVSVFAYFTVLQAVIMTSWLFSHNFPLNYCMEVALGLLIASVVWFKLFQYKNTRAKPLSRPRFIVRADLYGIIVAFCVLFLIMAGPVVKSWQAFDHHIQLSSVVIDYIDTSLDDSNHLSRINDRLQLNRGVLYETNVTQYVVHGDSVSTYPPAWHSANALVIKSVDPKIVVGGQSAIAYVITKLLWTFIMVYLFCRATFMLAYELGGKRSRRRAIVGDLFILGTTLFLAYYTLLEQFQEGFYTFIPLIISLMLLVPLLMQLSRDKESKLNNKYRVLLPLIVVVVNLTLSWFLLMPAAILATVIALLYSAKKHEIPKTLRKIYREAVLYLPILIFSFLGVLVQLIVIMAPSSQTFTVGVNTPGNIVMHSVAYFIFIGIGLFVIYLFSKQFVHLVQYVGILLVCLLGFSFFIYLFQIVTVHSPEYYYYKTIDAFILCATPLALVGWLRLLRFISNSYNGLTAIVMVVGVLMAIPIVIGIEPPNYALLTYIHGGRAISPVESAYIYGSISQRAQVPLSSRTADVIMFEPGDPGFTLVGTNILRSIQPVNNCDDLQFTDLLNDNPAALFQTIHSCQVTPLTIVTQQNSYAALVQLAKNYNVYSNIHIQSIE